MIPCSVSCYPYCYFIHLFLYLPPFPFPKKAPPFPISPIKSLTWCQWSALKTYVGVALYRWNRLYLGICMYTLTLICMQQLVIWFFFFQKRSHEFEGSNGGIKWSIWREWRKRKNSNQIIISTFLILKINKSQDLKV